LRANSSKSAPLFTLLVALAGNLDEVERAA
jgi:hypothetical protein